MKKLLSILIALSMAVCMMALTSCDQLADFFHNVGEEIGNQLTKDKFVGEYELYEVVLSTSILTSRQHIGDDGVTYEKSDVDLIISDDNTFKLSAFEAERTGTWKKENGKYYLTPDAYENADGSSGNTDTLEAVFENDDVFYLDSSSESEINMNIILSRKGYAPKIDNYVGTYNVYEKIMLEDGYTTRQRVTDKGSTTEADEITITLNADKTAAVTVFGTSNNATWTQNGKYIIITVGENVTTLTVVEDELTLEISAITTYGLKKVS